jgi:signal peptidase I
VLLTAVALVGLAVPAGHPQPAGSTVALLGGILAGLRPGDRVLVRRVAGETRRHGEVVVVEEPGPCWPGDPTGARSSRWVVKRVAAVPGDPEPPFLPAWARRPSGIVAPGYLVLLGDNAELSRDSRHFGAVRADRVLGVALRRLGGGKLPPGPPART